MDIEKYIEDNFKSESPKRDFAHAFDKWPHKIGDILTSNRYRMGINEGKDVILMEVLGGPEKYQFVGDKLYKIWATRK